MSPFVRLLLIVFAGQMALSLFLMFGHRGLPLQRRAIAAFGSAGLAISVAALIFAPFSVEPLERGGLAILPTAALLCMNVGLAARLIGHFREGADSFSCLGTLGRGLGCVAVSYGLFALVLLIIAGLWGATIWLTG